MFESIETFKCKTLEAVQRFREDERGVTAMEYGLIAALIGVAAVTAMTEVGTALIGKLNDIRDVLNRP